MYVIQVGQKIKEDGGLEDGEDGVVVVKQNIGLNGILGEVLLLIVVLKEECHKI